MALQIPSGLTRDHIFKALADLTAGGAYPDDNSSGYELLHEGRRFPAGAVVSLACRYLIGQVLRPSEFSDGDAPGEAAFVLQQLGFVVAPVTSSDETDDSEQLLEVKMTGLGKFFPFYVTATEVRCSEATSDRYRLVRVFDAGRNTRLYTLSGSLRDRCQLDPVLFRAVI